jgi:hypothetical protein
MNLNEVLKMQQPLHYLIIDNPLTQTLGPLVQLTIFKKRGCIILELRIDNQYEAEMEFKEAEVVKYFKI